MPKKNSRKGYKANGNMASQTVLYVSGRTTDIAMDSGDGVSHRVPINESYTLHHATLRLAGRDYTEYFLKNFTKRRYSFTASAAREIARNVTESYIGVDDDTELKSASEINKGKSYEFPDGNIIIDGAQRFRFVKVFFQPSYTVKKPVDSTTLLSTTS